MKRQKLSIEQTAEKVIEHFDFERVYKVMKLLEWQWCSASTEDKVPTIGALVNTARKLLIEAGSKVYANSRNVFMVSGGGFKATATLEQDGEVILELCFYVTEFNWSSEDTCY